MPKPVPKYHIKKRYVVYYPPEQIVWNGQTFDSERLAKEAVVDFWNKSEAWNLLAKMGWVIKPVKLYIKD